MEAEDNSITKLSIRYLKLSLIRKDEGLSGLDHTVLYGP